MKKQGGVNIKLTIGLALALALSLMGLVVALADGEKTKAKLTGVQQELSESEFFLHHPKSTAVKL